MERAPESVPIVNERRERIVQGVSVGAPLLAVIAAGWIAWGSALRWHDVVVFVVMYLLTGMGITLGYHRLFAHRSFKTTRGVRAVLAAPHLEHRLGWRGALSGLVYAHVGWVFRGKDRANPARYVGHRAREPRAQGEGARWCPD